MFVKVFLQALALSGAGVWVHLNTIRELGVQFFSGRFVLFVGHILLHTGVDNRSF